MSREQQQLEIAIAALEAQRAQLGDAVVDAGLGALRAKLDALDAGAAGAAGQRLKQVTILFLDMVGSTTLSQRLHPEEIHAVMDGGLSRCSALVKSHGGRVLQYAGDNLLAAFGAEGAREDDGERAVRCGLELVDLGRSLGAEVQAAHGHAGFNVRVGIHTGGVLLGGGVDEEGTIRGMAVNIAARMEQTAPAGGLRISHATYTQVRGVFDVEPQNPITVKGVDQPIVTYLVMRAKRDDGPDMAEGHAHLLGHLIGLDYSTSRHIRGIRDDPKQIRNRAFHAAAQMFRRVSAQTDTPIVLQNVIRACYLRASC
jgi:class 3 adenylate cyclase